MLKIDINLVFTIINLLLLFVAMRIFFFKPIKKIIDERQAEADRKLEDAKSKQDEANELKAQYESSLSDAQEEKKKIIAQARKDADVEYQKILKDAQEAADDVRKAAIAEAENKKAQIIKSAEKEITAMVAEAAAKAIGIVSGEAEDRALYDKFINKEGDEQ